jgi:hypothetical protein
LLILNLIITYLVGMVFSTILIGSILFKGPASKKVTAILFGIGLLSVMYIWGKNLSGNYIYWFIGIIAVNILIEYFRVRSKALRQQEYNNFRG